MQTDSSESPAAPIPEADALVDALQAQATIGSADQALPMDEQNQESTRPQTGSTGPTEPVKIDIFDALQRMFGPEVVKLPAVARRGISAGYVVPTTITPDELKKSLQKALKAVNREQKKVAKSVSAHEEASRLPEVLKLAKDIPSFGGKEDSEDWEAWAQKFEAICLSLDIERRLWGFLAYVKLSHGSPAADFFSSEWKQLHPDNQPPSVANLTWDQISAIMSLGYFVRKDSVFVILQQIIAMRQGGGIHSHIMAFERLFAKLGQPVPEWMKCVLFLRTLRDEYTSTTAVMVDPTTGGEWSNWPRCMAHVLNTVARQEELQKSHKHKAEAPAAAAAGSEPPSKRARTDAAPSAVKPHASGAGPSGTASRPVPAQLDPKHRFYIPGLTPEQYEARKKGNLCLICGHVGHLTKVCKSDRAKALGQGHFYSRRQDPKGKGKAHHQGN